MRDIREYIKYLPVNSARKLMIYQNIRELYWRIKYSGNDYNNILRNRTFCNTNYYYGHEYWMKRHSGYSGFIYGLIEHGLYFGDNSSKVGFKEEWDLGSIITFGDSRINLLKDLYPDYYIFGVGPRIHYAEMDNVFYNQLKSQINPNEKTMVLYPFHSEYSKKAGYDTEVFMKNASDLAKDLGVGNILVSLHPADIANHFDREYEGKRFITVSAGLDQIRFLPKLKAIMSIADIIYSNAIGTHVGYSLYLNKPNIINLTSNKTILEKSKYNEEQELFAKTFNGNSPFSITAEQRELCDYYFGYRYIRTPEDLYKIFEDCDEQFTRRFKRKM